MSGKSIERKIDQLGRIVIPAEIRRDCNMPTGTICKFRTNKAKVILEGCSSKIQMVKEEQLGEGDIQGACPYCCNKLMKRFNLYCCGNCGNKIKWKNEEGEA